MENRLNRGDIAFLVCTVLVFLFFYRAWPSSAIYGYDEADYMQSASAGLADNILERPSMSVVEFLKAGFSQGLDASKRKDLSKQVRTLRDITFFRHYHGPIYFYYLSLLTPFIHSEQAERLTGLFFHVVTFLAIYCGITIMTASRVAAAISSFLLLFSSSVLGTAALITPHNIYFCTATLTLLAFARFLQTRWLAWWYAAVAGFALSVCSIEYAVLLPVTFAVCLWMVPEARVLSRSALMRSALLFLIVLAIAWPVGVFELSVLKSYFFFAHAILKKTGNYGEDTFLGSWIKRMSLSPPEYAIDIVCAILAVVLLRRLKHRAVVLPFLVYAGLMFITTIKNKLLMPTYTSSIMPCLAVVSGILIAHVCERFSPRARAAVAIAIMLIVTIDGARGYRIRTLDNQLSAAPGHELVARLRAGGHLPQNVLVPFELLPVLSYYLPNMQFTSYLSNESPAAILDRLREGGFNTLVYADRAALPLPPGSPTNGTVNAPADFKDEGIVGPLSGLGNVSILRAPGL